VGSLGWLTVTRSLLVDKGEYDGERQRCVKTHTNFIFNHSCGGLEAYSASYHDSRVKTTLICNSGVIDEEKKYLLAELKAPVAYFIGGPKDIAYKNVCIALFRFQSLDRAGKELTGSPGRG
jgi:hypothetical protein